MFLKQSYFKIKIYSSVSKSNFGSKVDSKPNLSVNYDVIYDLHHKNNIYMHKYGLNKFIQKDAKVKSTN